MEILNIYNDMGTVHNFRMFKESLVGVLPKDIWAMLDSGYHYAFKIKNCNRAYKPGVEDF